MIKQQQILSNNIYHVIFPIINRINEYEDNYVNQQTTLVIEAINKYNYLTALNILNKLKQYTNKVSVIEDIDYVIKFVSYYESVANMNNYLNNR
jgi:hypothetical protein